MAEKFCEELMTISFSGPATDDNEIEVDVLANSLLSFKNLIDQTNGFINRRQPIAVKVKGFHSGSFVTTLAVEYIAPFTPLVPEIVNSIKSLVELKTFLDGAPSKAMTPREDGMVEIKNVNGNVYVTTNHVVAMHNSAPVTNSLRQALEPLEHGITSVSINPGPESVQISSEEKKRALPASTGSEESFSEFRELEVLTPNIDGKPAKWRFYDPEDETEFLADIMDETFLADVRSKKYAFRQGDMIAGTLYTVKRLVNERKRTERYVTDIQGGPHQENL